MAKKKAGKKKSLVGKIVCTVAALLAVVGVATKVVDWLDLWPGEDVKFDYEAFIEDGVELQSPSDDFFTTGKVYRLDLTCSTMDAPNATYLNVGDTGYAMGSSCFIDWYNILNVSEECVKVDETYDIPELYESRTEGGEYGELLEISIDVEEYFEFYISEDKTYADVYVLKDHIKTEKGDLRFGFAAPNSNFDVKEVVAKK